MVMYQMPHAIENRDATRLKSLHDALDASEAAIMLILASNAAVRDAMSRIEDIDAASELIGALQAASDAAARALADEAATLFDISGVRG